MVYWPLHQEIGAQTGAQIGSPLPQHTPRTCAEPTVQTSAARCGPRRRTAGALKAITYSASRGESGCETMARAESTVSHHRGEGGAGLSPTSLTPTSMSCRPSGVVAGEARGSTGPRNGRRRKDGLRAVELDVERERIEITRAHEQARGDQPPQQSDGHDDCDGESAVQVRLSPFGLDVLR